MRLFSGVSARDVPIAQPVPARVSGVKNSAGDLHTLLSTAPGSRRADVKVAASARSRSGDVERYQLTGNRRLLYSAYTQTTGCADNKELRWNAPR